MQQSFRDGRVSADACVERVDADTVAPPTKEGPPRVAKTPRSVSAPLEGERVLCLCDYYRPGGVTLGAPPISRMESYRSCWM
jgi:hypothetical protein